MVAEMKKGFFMGIEVWKGFLSREKFRVIAVD
jgi:hypothetical protein